MTRVLSSDLGLESTVIVYATYRYSTRHHSKHRGRETLKVQKTGLCDVFMSSREVRFKTVMLLLFLLEFVFGLVGMQVQVVHTTSAASQRHLAYVH